MSVIPEQEIRVEDFGTLLELEFTENSVAVDISAATTKTITLKRPDNTTVTRAGIFTTDGTDGKVGLTVISTDFTMSGTYYIQGYVVLPAWDGKSSIQEFEVHENLG